MLVNVGLTHAAYSIALLGGALTLITTSINADANTTSELPPMVVIPILLQLYGATKLTKGCRDFGCSWPKTVLIGMGVGAALALSWAMPFKSECAGVDMYGGYDCEQVEKKSTPWHEGFLTTTAVGLAAVASRRSYEER